MRSYSLQEVKALFHVKSARDQPVRLDSVTSTAITVHIIRVYVPSRHPTHMERTGRQKLPYVGV
jgi:hypothetical protein